MSKVVIIDDSKTIRMVVKKSILSNPDIVGVSEEDIVEGENGLDLVAACSKYAGEIDYIFLDINMPMLKGDEALWALNKSNRLRNAKIIFITTEEFKDIMKRKEKHVVGHIKKPISFETLPNIIKEVLSNIKSKEQQEIEYQQSIISKSIYNYLLISQVPKDNIDIEKIKKVSNKYFNAEPILERDIILTCEKIFKEYTASKELQVNINLVKFTFIFDSVKEDIDNNTSSTIVVHHTLEEIKEYLSDCDEIGIDCSIDTMVDDYFKKFLNIVRKLGDITNPEYKRFSNDFSTDDTETIERFLIEALGFFKKIDYSIESSKVRQSIRNAHLLRDYKNRILNIDKNPRDAFDAFCDEYQPKYSGSKNYTMAMSNKSSDEHKKYLKLLSNFVFKYKDLTINKAMNYLEKIKSDRVEFVYKYNVYTLYKELLSQMKNSNIIKQYFGKTLPNSKVSLKTLLEHMLDKSLRDSMNFANYKKILDYLQKEPLKVILLSNDTDSSKVLESTIRQMSGDWEFIAFAQNSILLTWLKSNRPDMIFIDSEYDATQQIPLASVFKKYESAVTVSDIVVLSDTSSKSIDKKLLSLSDALLKKPLDEAKLIKVLSFT
jgi:CheY-like chemotaxis protein